MRSDIYNSALAKGLFAIAVGAIIWFIPIPEGIKDPRAWKLLAIFVSTILAFILQPLPMGTISCITIAVSTATGVLKIDEALSGFANSTVWLVVSAFIFARAFINANLGRRIAYLIIRAIGTSPLKLAYALCLSDLLIAPATPSNTARAGGIIFPIVKSVATVLGSEPGPSARKIGAFLIKAVYNGDTVCSSMFLTATASNTLLAALAVKILKIDISWGTWALAAFVPGIVAFAVVPYFIYMVNPPELTETPEARELATKELVAMGPMGRQEKVVTGVFVGMLVLWATSQVTGLNATTVAFMGVSTLFLTKVTTWRMALEESAAWDTLVWMGTIVGMATYLNNFGLVPWFAKTIGLYVVGLSWTTAMFIICICYLYAHYAFASMTAHVTALFPGFAAIGVAAGVPPYLAVLILAFATNISGSLTHYAAGPTPIFFGAGYVSQADWWRTGFMLSVIQLVIWLGIGGIWWKIIGLW